MRLSTGIILSILSTNVFAIENLNDVHSGSLLARRAVVADTDGPFLQKRSGDEDQKKQAKPKTSVSNPNSGQGGDGAGGGPTDSYTYVPNQDRGATGESEDAHIGLGSGQGKSRFGDAPGGSSSRVLGSIKKKLSRTKHGVGLLYRLERASAASKSVKSYFGGKKGDEIKWHVHEMLIHALKKSKEYKLLYLDPDTSPFSLKLPSSISDKSRKIYRHLQNEVQKSSRNHISAIMHAVEYIFFEPYGVVPELENMMKNIDSFYISTSNMKAIYSGLLKELGMSGSGHLINLDAHMNLLGAYKCNLSDRLNVIKEVLGYSIIPPNQEGSSSTLESMGRSEIGIKPSDDVTSSSTQSKDVASSSTPSDNGASGSAQPNVAVSGLVPAIQKSRLRLLGRALDPGVENVYTWLRGGVLNGEADLDQRWLDGTVEHESMGTRHDNRALAARLADFLQVAYRQYQSTLWKYHRDRLVEVG
ncbi:hypothetical protein BASA61_009012 [Batrachochytrium salamandrivorans]|nr:hypothetical protein BASA61_009012 [Batrachochytrium salamandrivorans]